MIQEQHIGTLLDHIIASIPLFKPEIALTLTFLGCIIASLFIDKYWAKTSFLLTLLGLAWSGYLLVQQIDHPQHAFFGMITVDNFSVYTRLLMVLSAVLTTLFIQQHERGGQVKQSLGDCYAVLLTAMLGLHLLTMSSNWLLVFIAIETVSISSYILVGYFSSSKQQSEAAMKYALFGSICAAAMLYGLSLLYGMTGNLDFLSAAHIKGLIEAPDLLISISLLFVFIGIGFKLSFVPFHVWSPDVYQGAPTPITAFLSTLPKIGAFVLLARLVQGWTASTFYFSEITLWMVSSTAIASMLIGNLAALRQTDIKRMMAYSSIGHTGFLLMAVVAYQQSFDYIVFYLTVYVAMNFATFICISLLEQNGSSTALSSYAGLGKKMPILFTCFTFVGVSLIGLPPTAGFVGKLFIFTQVFERYDSTGDILYLWLLIVGAISTVIALFYYFKIPLYAFLRTAQRKDSVEPALAPTNRVLLVLTVLLTATLLALGLFPTVLLPLLK